MTDATPTWTAEQLAVITRAHERCAMLKQKAFCSECAWIEALAAVRREFDQAKIERVPLPSEHYTDKILELERRVAALTQERETLEHRITEQRGLVRDLTTALENRNRSGEAAEAQVAQLREALEQIEVYTRGLGAEMGRFINNKARAALAGAPPPAQKAP